MIRIYDQSGNVIETQEQAEALRELGCEIGQGFLFAKPLPAAELDGLLVANAR